MKDDRVDLLKKILLTNVNLDFLSDLEQRDLECRRYREWTQKRYLGLGWSGDEDGPLP